MNLYNTRKWRATREQMLREHPLCTRCLSLGVVKAAKVIDHCIPSKAYDDFYDTKNLFQICHTCHNQVTEIYDNHNAHEIFERDYHLIKYSNKEFKRSSDGFPMDEELDKILLGLERVGRGVEIPPIVE